MTIFKTAFRAANFKGMQWKLKGAVFVGMVLLFNACTVQKQDRIVGQRGAWNPTFQSRKKGSELSEKRNHSVSEGHTIYADVSGVDQAYIHALETDNIDSMLLQTASKIKESGNRYFSHSPNNPLVRNILKSTRKTLAQRPFGLQMKSTQSYYIPSKGSDSRATWVNIGVLISVVAAVLIMALLGMEEILFFDVSSLLALMMLILSLLNKDDGSVYSLMQVFSSTFLVIVTLLSMILVVGEEEFAFGPVMEILGYMGWIFFVVGLMMMYSEI